MPVPHLNQSSHAFAFFVLFLRFHAVLNGSTMPYDADPSPNEAKKCGCLPAGEFLSRRGPRCHGLFTVLRNLPFPACFLSGPVFLPSNFLCFSPIFPVEIRSVSSSATARSAPSGDTNFRLDCPPTLLALHWRRAGTGDPSGLGFPLLLVVSALTFSDFVYGCW
jgi:hypothetical protein